MRGFIVRDWVREVKAFLTEVGPLVACGQLKALETIVEGLENAPTGVHRDVEGRECREDGGEDLRPVSCPVVSCQFQGPWAGSSRLMPFGTENWIELTVVFYIVITTFPTTFLAAISLSASMA